MIRLKGWRCRALRRRLGTIVYLHGIADDSRVTAIVAAETFSDLRTIATEERAPFFFAPFVIARAFSLAEHQGRFDVAAVSPVVAAARIVAPALLIHGAADRETPPDHSRRVFDALRGPKRLIVVAGAGHNESRADDVWRMRGSGAGRGAPASDRAGVWGGAPRETSRWIEALPHP